MIDRGFFVTRQAIGPGHLQVWIRVSTTPLEPAVATEIGRQLARAYGGDLASTDWRHLGRLAGFTNHKPERRTPGRYAPWGKLLHTRAVLATHGASLGEAAQRRVTLAPSLHDGLDAASFSLDPSLRPSAASQIYQSWLHRLRIPQRFPQPDWSIAGKWIAEELLRPGTPLAQVYAILQLGSPGFPRRHFDPANHLRRTLARAILELHSAPFPGRDRLPHRRPRLAGERAPAFP